MDLFIDGIKNGLIMGGVFALMALGYSMVYGIVKMINFAHSEFITIGAFVCYFLSEYLYKKFDKSVWVLLICLIVSIILCVVVAILTERLAYRPLRKKGSNRITALITAIGVSYVLYGVLGSILKGTKRISHVFEGNEHVNTVFIIAIVVTAVLLVSLTFFVQKTKVGIAMRAVAENESASKLMGINNNRIISLTFVLGSALAAIGVLIYLLVDKDVSAELGNGKIGFYPFIAAVIGGIGSLPGAVVGGFLIGIISELCKVYEYGTFIPTIVYSIFVIILLLKPAGILGKDTREKV